MEELKMKMNMIANLIYLGFAVAYLTIMYTERKKVSKEQKKDK